VFPHLNDESCAAVIDTQDHQLVRAFDDIEDAEIYMRRRQFKPPRYEAREIHEFVAGSFVGYSAFVVESICNLLLTRLVDQGVTPHVLIATQAINCTLDDLLADPRHSEPSICKRELSNREIASLFLQTVCAVDTIQRVCKLKHHDLHTGNVFLRRITEGLTFKGEDLSTAAHFHYHVSGKDFYVPNCGLLVKIGDFGMASFNVGDKRVQRVDMDVFNDDIEKWGAWNAHYEGERGYDTQVLFADIPVDHRHLENHELHRFFKHARATTTGKKGRVSRKKGRPLPGHVSNSPASSVLESVFTRRLEPWFDFTAQPADGKTITLSDTRWL
jgi:serine/threonine protein kinase